MKIFITGINSFVGKELVKILKKKKIKFFNFISYKLSVIPKKNARYPSSIYQ